MRELVETVETEIAIANKCSWEPGRDDRWPKKSNEVTTSAPCTAIEEEFEKCVDIKSDNGTFGFVKLG